MNLAPRARSVRRPYDEARRLFEPGRIRHVNRNAEQFGRLHAPVPRQARHIRDERRPPPGQAVEQRRFSDVRSANDGDGWRFAHFRVPGVTSRHRNQQS